MLSLVLAFLLTAPPAAPPRVEFIAAAGENVNGLALNNPQGLSVNPRREEFLVADALNDRIVIFDTAGFPAFTFPLGGDRHNPFGVAVNSQGEIVVAPMDSQVLWFYDFNGSFLNDIPLPLEVFPGRLLIGPDDEIMIVNRAGRSIIVLDKAGKIIMKYESPETICKPSGVCLDHNGKVILVSAEGDVITAFDAGGKVAYTLGTHGRRPEDFSHPTSAVIDSAGWLWIVDSFRHHINRFDRNRNFVDFFGEQGIGQGQFYYPVDIKITPGGKLGVLEKGSGRLQIFRLKYGK